MASDLGRNVLEAFQSVGCPGIEAWGADDLDWLASTSEETRSFLTWLTQSLEPELALTIDELEAWQRLQADRPDDILQGELLEEALASLVASEKAREDDMSLTELQLVVERLQEQLNLQSATLEDLDGVSSGLRGQQTRMGVSLSDLTPLMEKESRNVRQKQDQIMNLNEEYNDALDELCLAIQSIMDRLRTYGDQTKERPIGEENVGEDDENVLNELSRLKDGLQIGQRNQWIAEAKFEGQKASLRHLKALQYQLTQGQLATDVGTLDKESIELERKIALLQSDISSLKRDQLVPLAENHGQLEVEKVVAIDLQNKCIESEFNFKKLEEFQEFLMSQRSLQTGLSGLLEIEKAQLSRLLEQFLQIISEMKALARDLEEEKTALENLSLFEMDQAKDQIHCQDHVMISLLSLLNEKSHHGEWREKDLMHVVQKLQTSIQSQEETKNQMEREMVDQQEQLNKGLPKLEKLINLDGWKHGSLTNPQILRQIQSLQQGMKGFELSVKNSLSQWEKENKAIQHDPHLYTQKRLWIDFLTNPKLLQANVDAMVKKAK
eukprot:TCALIF_00756-PA protein Name:"Protein of unknown function" AED:0.03 eAED:0.03 QI:63/0.83/0.85/1/0.66/0.57/7/37/551